MLLAGLMTRGARSLGVRADQRELGHSMIKGVRVEAYDIRVAPLVIGVAVLALLPLHLGIAAMKPFFLFEVNAHRLVACQALLILPAFFKQDVTLGTLRFVFGVTLDHGPRHQKFFIRVGICLQRQQQHYYSC